MKTAFCGIIFLVVFYASAFASANSAEVHGAQLNLQNSTIEVEISYSACQNHDFQVQMRSCTRSKPANCVAELVDMTPADACRAFITETVVMPAGELLQQRHVSHLIIMGAEESAAEVVVENQAF